MPAPRLLDKKTIQVSLAAERKQEIDRGVKLAKSIDALQEAKEGVEQELDMLRTKTLVKIQQEIDAKASENDLLAKANAALKEERIRLEAPVDLTQAWDEVKELKATHEELANELLMREIEVSKRENDVYDDSNGLKTREERIGQSEKEAKKSLDDAETLREEAEQARASAEQMFSTAQEEKRRQENSFAEKETELVEREQTLEEKEMIVQEELLDITNQKIYLADQRATLERGFAELRRKQQR